MTAIDTRVGGVTVRVVLPTTVSDVALIVVVPAATPVARPPESMVAAAGTVLAHDTPLVMSAVDVSE